MNSLNDIYQNALKTFGKPYVWGGSGPESFDCSGLVIYILKQLKILPNKDMSADDLYKYFLMAGTLNATGMGSLAFFGSVYRVVHVGWCIDNYIMINASGGNSECTNIEIAKRINASVKIEPISMRNNLVAIIKPAYWGYGI